VVLICNETEDRSVTLSVIWEGFVAAYGQDRLTLLQAGNSVNRNLSGDLGAQPNGRPHIAASPSPSAGLDAGFTAVLRGGWIAVELVRVLT